MINPYASPWYRSPKIQNQKLSWRWQAINKHLTHRVLYREHTNQLIVNEEFIISKNSYKFRLLSHLDWAYYNPRELAQAMSQNEVPKFYEQQLLNSRSDPNEWTDKPREMELKSYYAWRRGRANLIKE